MSTWKVWRVVVLCVMVTGAIVPGRAQTARSKPVNEALTVNGDGAQRSKDIHWPDGFHPEQADLFAHNEIAIHAPCKSESTPSRDCHVRDQVPPDGEGGCLVAFKLREASACRAPGNDCRHESIYAAPTFSRPYGDESAAISKAASPACRAAR